MEHFAHVTPRLLANQIVEPMHYPGVNGTTCVDSDQCWCNSWYDSYGSNLEGNIATGCQWFAFSFSVIILIFYAWHTWKATTGWEEVYVCAVELIKVSIEAFHEYDSPATLYLSTGKRVLWIRYSEWLLTCPVILIHLSNITGLKDDYSKRTMTLLVSDLGTIVFGATAALSTGFVKVIFFLLGCCYGANTFFNAAKVYIQSYHMVPKGPCKNYVRVMAWVYFISWGMFPVLFVLGPEGFNHISFYGSTIGHTVVDVMSKNLWGFLGHMLRVKIHEHILIHGDIRKTVKVKVAGEEMEIQTFMAEEDEDTVKHSTKELASRESFLVMRDRMKERGVDVRASLDADALPIPADNAAKVANINMNNVKGFNGNLEAGRIILAVPDISMVEFFREQFSGLPVAMELVPALGIDNAVQLVQQAMNLGGCDFVLMHPEFLRDKSSTGLVHRMKQMNQRCCAFGWASAGPMRDLIESSNLDGWLEGPSFGTGINNQQLLALVGRMQMLKKTTLMNAMGMGYGGMGMMGGGMGGMGMMNNNMGMNMNMMNPMMNNIGMNNMNNMNNNANMGMGQMGQMGQMGSMNNGVNGMNGISLSPANSIGGASPMQQPRINNPLYGSSPSPMGSQPGVTGSMTGNFGGAAPSVSPATPGAGGAASEAEMLQQLMSEISRLKSELGEGQH